MCWWIFGHEWEYVERYVTKPSPPQIFLDDVVTISKVMSRWKCNICCQTKEKFLRKKYEDVRY